MTMSSSADWSSMTRLYLKPLHPPGCTLTRSPPRSAVTPSASINFLTSTPAFGVMVRSTSGCDETDIYTPVLLEFRSFVPVRLVSRSHHDKTARSWQEQHIHAHYRNGPYVYHRVHTR